MSIPPVHIHDDGSGPAVVLLHAFPLDAAMWDPQVALLRSHHRCLRPDFWGCGESPPPGDDHSLETYAATVLDELARMGVGRFALAGLSMGGYAAMAMLRRAPERVSRVVFAATRAGADGDAGRETRLAMARAVLSEGSGVIVESMTSRLLSEAAQADAEIAGFVRASILGCSPAGIAACQEAMAARPDSTALMAELPCPALVVAGELDALIPGAEMEAMAAAAGTTCHVIPGAGHLINLEAAAEFSDLVDDFLDAEG